MEKEGGPWPNEGSCLLLPGRELNPFMSKMSIYQCLGKGSGRTPIPRRQGAWMSEMLAPGTPTSRPILSTNLGQEVDELEPPCRIRSPSDCCGRRPTNRRRPRKVTHGTREQSQQQAASCSKRATTVKVKRPSWLLGCPAPSRCNQALEPLCSSPGCRDNPIAESSSQLKH